MVTLSRRAVLGAAAAAVGARYALPPGAAFAGPPPFAEVPLGPRPAQDASVKSLNPRGRVPLSFIIDDSTCLVNMGHFCMPQFKAAWPQNPIYRRPWQDWPREIPDAFVREFGEWCAGQGVRGKYSLVPYPACVGWLDRGLPGWSKQELDDSLKLVREVMMPNWDITPEMATHTRVIDLKTGRPMDGMSAATMENSWPPEKRSVDEMAAYMAYALGILKNAGITCQAVTTPGGFGNKCKTELSLAVRQAVADVFAPEVAHYFKYIADGEQSAAPRVENVTGLETGSPTFTVNVPAGIGDEFGGWDGDRPPQPDKYVTADATAGRLKELIDRGEPAVMFGHWAGLFSNGSKAGFAAARRVITTLNATYGDRTIWMSTGEMARYWAARELTAIARAGDRLTLSAPVAAPAYTVTVSGAKANAPAVSAGGKPVTLNEAKDAKSIKSGTWLRAGDAVTLCWDLAKGETTVTV